MQTERIAIIGAMDSEIASLLEAMEERREEAHWGLTFYLGRLEGQNIVLVKCGIGKVNAARCTQILLDLYAPSALLHTGIAGGIGPGLKVGDAVIAQGLIQHDFDVTAFGYARGNICDRSQRKKPSVFAADVEIMDALENAACQALGAERVHRGLVVTGDQFISGPVGKGELYQAFHGLAAEMEGGAVAQTATLGGVPFGVLRTISDLADGTAADITDDFERQTADISAAIIRATLKRL